MMEVFEICINDETFVSSRCELEVPVNTQILENNLYSKNLFLKNDIFYWYSEQGPIEISHFEMSKILLHSEDN